MASESMPALESMYVLIFEQEGEYWGDIVSEREARVRFPMGANNQEKNALIAFIPLKSAERHLHETLPQLGALLPLEGKKLLQEALKAVAVGVYMYCEPQMRRT